MLVLSRKIDETVILTINGTRVVVQVVRVLGDKVRLGFKAPDDVTVHRGEIQELIDMGYGYDMKDGGQAT